MKLLPTLLLVLFINTLSAQTNFRNVSFADALRMAKEEGKMVIMQLESQECDPCNEVANKGLDDKEVGNRIEQAFVAIKISPKHADRSQIESQYNMPKGFGTLFIDMNGTLIKKLPGTTSNPKEYLRQIDLALYSGSEGARINELEKEYIQGNRSISFLESLLIKRRSLNFNTDDLLEEYVSLLSEDSLKSFRTITFIAQMAPMLNSRANTILHKDQQIFYKAWYAMNMQLRTGINNVIIYKGMKKAVAEKNEAEAKQVATFAQTTNMSNYADGAKAYDKNMLFYYEKTDTSKYFIKAIAYFDRYYVVVSADSIRKRDSFTVQMLLKQARITDSINNKNQKADTIINGHQLRRTSIRFTPAAQTYAQDLNNGAWNFYKMTNNPYLLSIALEWSIKSLEFFKSPEILDTYARLLYKQNQKQKAIESESEAIAIRRQQKFSTKDYDEILDRMKRNATVD